MPMSNFFKALLLLLLPSALFAQTGPQKITLHDELRQLYDISLLPAFRSNTQEMEETSYDRTGGNDDGDSGAWSFVKRNEDSSLVLLDVDGPGVINRFATPTPSTDTLDIFIDDLSKPALSICYRDLFSGKVFPFVAPLCGNSLGGYYCYFPILFQSHCRIVSRGHRLRYHQVQYRLFAKETPVSAFVPELSPNEKDDLTMLQQGWASSSMGLAGRRRSKTASLAPGETRVLASWNKGGRIEGIELDTAGAGDCRLRIFWDDGQQPAIDCRVTDFFGYALGRPAMESLLVGTRGATNYVYFPMPFSKRARIELVNESMTASYKINAAIWTDRRPLLAGSEGYFRTYSRSDTLRREDLYHVLLDANGRGHYVGTILLGQGLIKGKTLFWEGDDSLSVDGAFRMHGTGTEDYFNGGWYALKGRWDTARSLPLYGCLGYSKEQSWSGGYRLMLSDKIPFDHSLYQAIEHGQTAVTGVPAYYRSIAFYYTDRP